MIGSTADIFFPFPSIIKVVAGISDILADKHAKANLSKKTGLSKTWHDNDRVNLVLSSRRPAPPGTAFEAYTLKELMVNVFNTKGRLVLAGVLAAGMLAGACSNNPDNVKTAEKANDSVQSNQSVTDSGKVPSKGDAGFMVKATSGNQLEVILGQLAQTNAASAGVKSFGQMMIKDHSEGEKELRGLAASKQIILPDTISNDQKKERDDLQKKTGREFDKAYVKLMVSDHKEDIDEFQKASQEANDPDIKALAAKMVPILQMHLDSVQALQKGSK